MTKLLVVLTTLLFAFFSSAQTITAYTEDLAPYQFKNYRGQYTGYSVELVNALFKQANINGKIRMVPWVRAYNSAIKEKNVLIFSMVRTPEREEMFHWIGEVDKLEYYFYRLSTRDDIQITDFKQAKKYRIGTGANSFEYEKLTYLGFPYVVSTPRYDQLISMLKANRYDLFFSAGRTFKGMLKKSNSSPDLFEAAYQIKHINQRMFIGMSKSSDPALVKQLQQAYKKIVSDGEKERLGQIWLN